MRYQYFLEQKKVRVEPSGFELHDDQLPTFLFDFVGVELKESYWECAVKNLDFVANKPQQLSLIA
jgi:hypothetical protein